MKEIHTILKAYDRCQTLGLRSALVTLVRVEGSSYRRPGARMLVDEQGQIAGAISGGCLEGDVQKKALQVISNGRPRLVTYETSDAADADTGFRLGCNGTIDVLIEPILSEAGSNPIHFLQQVASGRQNGVIATIFNPSPVSSFSGTCFLMTEDGEITAGRMDDALLAFITAHSRGFLREKQSGIKVRNGRDESQTVFFHWIRPQIRLVIAGSGYDVLPLVAMATELGWDIVCCDNRNLLYRRDAFPVSCQFIPGDPALALASIIPDPNTVYMLMTHNYQYDLKMLRHILRFPTPYIGILGPASKSTKMRQELKEEGFLSNPSRVNHIFCPAGLDTGAETAEEIALSILAEIQMILNKGSGGMLRDMHQPIHRRKRSREMEQWDGS